jgi:exopolysaccharide production protein ExoQ
MHGPLPTAAPASRPARPKRDSLLLICMMWVLIVFTIVPEGLRYRADPVNSFAGTVAQNAALALTDMPTEGSPLSRSIWLCLLAFGAVTVLSRSRAALKLLREINPYLLLFVGLVALSILWSIEPNVTLRRLVRASTLLLDAVAFALLARDVVSFQRTLRPIFLAMLIASIIFVMAAPDLAVEQANQTELVGAWHGVAPQKNGLGSLAAIGLVFWVHAWLSRESRSWLALLGIGVSALCLVRSRSSTSLMAGVFASVLLLMLLRSPRGLRRYLPYLIGLFVVLLLTYSLAVLNLIPGSGLLLSPITAITGKDQTFSGRTAIWEIITQHISLHPLLGTGYGAYWVQVPNSPSMQMLQQLYFYPTEAHNGYLDVINDLGYVGAACLIGYLITYVRQALRVFALVRIQGALYLALIFEQLVANLSEARWFNALSNEFVVMTIATAAIAKVLLDSRRQIVPGATGRARAAGLRAASGR